jgi:hypothetical protein
MWPLWWPPITVARLHKKAASQCVPCLVACNLLRSAGRLATGCCLLDHCGTARPPSQAGGAAAVADMEAEFLSLGLDIIGLGERSHTDRLTPINSCPFMPCNACCTAGVFNYDFGSITSESPVIKVGGQPPVLTLHRHSVVLILLTALFAIVAGGAVVTALPYLRPPCLPVLALRLPSCLPASLPACTWPACSRCTAC